MGLRKTLLDIKTRDLKNAHKIMKALTILGISENDLLEIKNIPEMKKELEELRQFKESVIRENRNEISNSKKEKVMTMEDLVEVFGGKVEEFNPNGKGNKE